MKNHLLYGLLSLVCAWPASARVLLVSDIDDTLKVSHVQAVTASAENAVHPGNLFLGMNDLFNSLQPSEGIQFSYVSNAPASLMSGLHALFLSFNSFPYGGLYLRDSILGSEDFKLKTILEQIRSQQPDRVILIGDNGQQDPIVYSRIQRTFPQIPVSVFIHQVYSVNSADEPATGLRVGEVGYATSVDLARELMTLGILAESDYRQFLSRVVPRVVAEKKGQYFGELAFPAWMNCQDYRPAPTNDSDSLWMKYEKKLSSRCSMKPE